MAAGGRRERASTVDVEGRDRAGIVSDSSMRLPSLTITELSGDLRDEERNELVCASALDGWSSIANFQEWIASSNSSMSAFEIRRAPTRLGKSTN